MVTHCCQIYRVQIVTSKMILVKNVTWRGRSKVFDYGPLLFSNLVLSNQKILKECQIINESFTLNRFSLGFGNLGKKLDNVKPSRIFIKNSKSEVLKKENTAPKIMVIDLNGIKSVMFKDQAEKLAKHKGLSLIEVQQKTSNINLMPQYTLAKRSDIFEEKPPKEGPSQQKTKTFIIKTNILAYDLQNKINMMMKCLGKKTVVMIDLINKNQDSEKLTEVFNTIKKEVQKMHKIQMTTIKNSGMKVKIVPGAVDSYNCESKEEKKHEFNENEKTVVSPEK